ncbi:STAS domain-containing protein [Streptomyces sp. NPDC101181]|uniref:STAS domain-containing protein n=1 Tax=Streptomyces sp. NPDC101181 TaxID=3366125 RepID=UPI00381B17B3
MTEDRQSEPTGIPAGTTVLRLRGELDFEDARSLTASVEAALGEDPRVLAVDVSAVTFADSSMLRTLVETQQRMEAREGTMVLVGPLTPPLRRLLEITATDGHFTIADDLAQATSASPPGRTAGDGSRD